MKIVVSVEGNEAEEGFSEAMSYASVLQESADLYVAKNRLYGSAWREQGYMGNLARIMSKTARLKAMLWGDVHTLSGTGESVEDTLKDLLNLSVFMILNIGTPAASGNKWGRR